MDNMKQGTDHRNIRARMQTLLFSVSCGGAATGNKDGRSSLAKNCCALWRYGMFSLQLSYYLIFVDPFVRIIDL